MEGQAADRARDSSAAANGPDFAERITGAWELAGRLSLIGSVRRYGLEEGVRRFAEICGIELPGGKPSIEGLRRGVGGRQHLAERILRDLTAEAMREIDERRFQEAFARFGIDTAVERSLVLYAQACLGTVGGDLEAALAAHARQEEGHFSVGEAVAVLEVLSLFNRYLQDLRPVEAKGELERARAADGGPNRVRP
jgi:hypothetical protein